MLPKIIDLFSGCGGLALGFEKAGFDIVAGIELMPEACQTISYNLDFRYGREQTHLCGDITEIDSYVFKDKFGEEGCIVYGDHLARHIHLQGGLNFVHWEMIAKIFGMLEDTCIRIFSDLYMSLMRGLL